MPVGFRVIFAHHKAFVAECLKHIAQYIAFRIVAKSMLGYREIGLFRVIHAETIMMFCCEQHVFHPCFIEC